MTVHNALVTMKNTKKLVPSDTSRVLQAQVFASIRYIDEIRLKKKLVIKTYVEIKLDLNIYRCVLLICNTII